MIDDSHDANGGAAGRKPYAKPDVTRFPLRPEEAVLGYCKTTGSTGPVGNCRNRFGPCNAPGS